eukprot:Blabericola_migrator_1__5241@NODE_2697_length_2449_cov_36_790932_g1686_i0_p2_GENE_NODE_2697_length_2449_cov_36_790932_g1686_i0NODE_2697_length_2449_cov_36_790932_g1686_i0_p2_ORF_typecomplete_len173_score22_04Hep_59/PF07052_11/0_048_NODE_2697_length_2449_cov_36_790932_g1686_i015552073
MFRPRAHPKGLRKAADEDEDEIGDLGQRICDLKTLQRLRDNIKGVEARIENGTLRETPQTRQLLTEAFHDNKDRKDPAREHFEQWVEKRIGSEDTSAGRIPTLNMDNSRDLYEVPEGVRVRQKVTSIRHYLLQIGSSIRSRAQSQKNWPVGLQEVSLDFDDRLGGLEEMKNK